MEDGYVILATLEDEVTKKKTDLELNAHLTSKQQELDAVLATQEDDIQRMQDEVDAKTIARMQRYAAERQSK